MHKYGGGKNTCNPPKNTCVPVLYVPAVMKSSWSNSECRKTTSVLLYSSKTR